MKITYGHFIKECVGFSALEGGQIVEDVFGDVALVVAKTGDDVVTEVVLVYLHQHDGSYICDEGEHRGPFTVAGFGYTITLEAD